jgi:hypothetical protein
LQIEVLFRREPQAERRGRKGKAIKSLKFNDPVKSIDFAPKNFNDLPRPNEAVRFALRNERAAQDTVSAL